MLNEQQIKDILNRPSKKMRSKSIGFEINQIEFTEQECQELIKTYIYEKKNIDIGKIQSVKGQSCISYMEFLRKNGVDTFQAMTESMDYNALDYVTNFVIRYYSNKFREQDDTTKKEDL